MTISVSPAVLSDLIYIDSLQKKNAEQLSFYPKIVFEREIENKRILLARLNAEPAGYIYHGAFGISVKIHQACIQYDLRGQLYGAELFRQLRILAEAANCMSITLRCGSDILANGFWSTMGFVCEGVMKGGARRMRDINCWRYDIAQQLFVIPVKPSIKQKDSSLWRKNKTEKKSQFLRGAALKAYRKEIEGGEK